MNTLRKIFVSITAVALLFLTSCLDDKDVNEFNGVMTPDFAATPYVVDFNEMPNSAGYIVKSFPGTIDPNQSYSANFRVNLSSPWQLDHDLTVTVSLDDDAANKFIAENPGFKLFPSSKHDLTTATVTIPAGEREAEVTVNFFTKGLSADDKFMMAISITDVSDPNIIVSGNFGTQYIKVGVYNLYHGTYALSGQWWYHGSNDFSGYVPTETMLLTTSSTGLVTQYSYAGWGNVEFEVSQTPETIDGHDNAYYVTITKSDDPDQFKQLDNYDGPGSPGGVFNYCYRDDNGKWVFKIAYQYYSNLSWHIYQQL